MDTTFKIDISRTEQWEYTASWNGISATGSSEISSERNLLRKIWKIDNQRIQTLESAMREFVEKMKGYKAHGTDGLALEAWIVLFAQLLTQKSEG